MKNYLSRVFEKLGVSSRFELLFLLFYGGNGLSSRGVGPSVSGLGNPIEVYLKAAEEGYAAAQFIVGLAHLDGYGIEKNGHSAYYWLRMAEENSSAVRQRSRALTEDLRTKINPGDMEALERSIATGARNDKILASKPVEDLFKTALASTNRSASSLSIVHSRASPGRVSIRRDSADRPHKLPKLGPAVLRRYSRSLGWLRRKLCGSLSAYSAGGMVSRG